MKFVTSRDLRTNPGPIFEALEGGGEVVVTSRGKPVALMLSVDADNVEDTLRAVRSAKAQAAVSRMRNTLARKKLDKAGRLGLVRITVENREHSER